MNTVRKKMSIGLVLGLFLASCSDGEQTNLNGKWVAKWTTLPSSFEGVAEITSFEMDGAFVFDGDSLTVVAYGYPGCVFGVDTIAHTQVWQMANDSLHLISEQNIRGISYRVKSVSDNQIELQLMEDIFLSLNRDLR